jgi:hypothetical protein
MIGSKEHFGLASRQTVLIPEKSKYVTYAGDAEQKADDEPGDCDAPAFMDSLGGSYPDVTKHSPQDASE